MHLRQPMMHFLSVQSSLQFLEFSIIGTTQHILVWAWLISRITTWQSIITDKWYTIQTNHGSHIYSMDYLGFFSLKLIQIKLAVFQHQLRSWHWESRQVSTEPLSHPKPWINEVALTTGTWVFVWVWVGHGMLTCLWRWGRVISLLYRFLWLKDWDFCLAVSPGAVKMARTHMQGPLRLPWSAEHPSTRGKKEVRYNRTH